MIERISDEIRKWCADLDSDDVLCTTATLYTLADRIDSEMAELPQSADGRIWTGREVCFWTGPAIEDWHKFAGLNYSGGKWCVEDDFESYPAVSVWHERPDVLERIADELDGMVDAADSVDDTREKLADLADRIRKLAAKGDGCDD